MMIIIIATIIVATFITAIITIVTTATSAATTTTWPLLTTLLTTLIGTIGLHTRTKTRSTSTPRISFIICITTVVANPRVHITNIREFA